MSSKLKAALVAALVVSAALAARAMWQSLRAAAASELGPISPWGAGARDTSTAPTRDATTSTAVDLTGATRAELYEEAKRRGIRGRSRMTKAELQAALGER